MSCNTIFSDLITTYPTWDELQHYIESEEGGLFRVVDLHRDGLRLIRYQKGVSKMDLPHSKWFRSVVWNSVMNRPVSVAPPKVTPADFPFQTLDELIASGVYCQEQLDGFMINCCRIAGDNTLYITSRSKLDAAGHFYSPKSFRRLFMESYLKSTVDDLESLIQMDTGMDAPDSSKREVAVFYSFLVQHMEHHVVTPISENKVFIVHRGVTYEDGTIVIDDVNAHCKNQYKITNIPLVSDSSDTHSWIANFLKLQSWDFQGIVFKDTLGNRWRFRNDKYSIVKSLRGNSATSLERFAQLYTQNLTYQYLQYYPHDNFPFSCHTIFMSMIVDTLYNYYVAVYITKTVHISTVQKMYVPHLYALHSIYVTTLRPLQKKVNTHVITGYFHSQPWQRIAFLVKKSQDAYFVQMGHGDGVQQAV